MQNHESPYSTVCTNDLDVELQEPEEPSSSAAPTIASCSQLDIQANDASNAVDERSIHSKSALGGGDAELRMFSAPEALGIEMTSVHTSRSVGEIFRLLSLELANRSSQYYHPRAGRIQKLQ